MKTVYSYIIDENDLIVSVDEAWKQFARDNGSPELIDQVVGKSLWDFIGNPLLTRLYQRAAEAVRKCKTDFKMDFRCDSPDQLRFMTMQIIALPEGRIKFENTLLHTQSRDECRPTEMVNRSLAPPLSLCGRCNRVRFEGVWLELDSLLDRLPDTDDQPVHFQFGLCSDCSDDISHKIATLNATLGYGGK
jgi:hypothetical protein